MYLRKKQCQVFEINWVCEGVLVRSVSSDKDIVAIFGEDTMNSDNERSCQCPSDNGKVEDYIPIEGLRPCYRI